MMEAKKWEDTVMTKEQVREALTYKEDVSREICDQCKEHLLKDQAKITGDIAFKAGEDKGKQEGIKEVVEFVEDWERLPYAEFDAKYGVRTDSFGLTKSLVDHIKTYFKSGKPSSKRG